MLIMEYLHDVKQKILRLCWPEPWGTAMLSAILGWHSITRLELTVPEQVMSVEKKVMAEGQSNCCLQLPVGGL